MQSRTASVFYNLAIKAISGVGSYVSGTIIGVDYLIQFSVMLYPLQPMHFR